MADLAEMLGSEPLLSINGVAASVGIAAIFTFVLYPALPSAARGEDVPRSCRALGATAGEPCGVLNVDLRGVRGVEDFPKSMLTYSAEVDNGAEKLRGRLAGLSWQRSG